jgi:hypothetical protein
MNLVQCSRCGNQMIHEEFDTHTCLPEPKDFVDLDITNFIITEFKNGKKRLTIISQDGTVYNARLHDESEAYEIPLSPDFEQRRKSPDDRTKPRVPSI